MAQVALSDTYLFSCAPFDPVTSAVVNVRFGTVAWHTESSDTPADATYKPGLSFQGFGSSILEQESGGMLGGYVEMDSGQVNLELRLGTSTTSPADDALPRYAWNGYPFTIYKIAKGAAFSAKTTYLVGYITGAAANESGMALTITSLNATLAVKQIQSEKFWGRKYALGFDEDYVGYVTLGDNCDFTGSFTIEALVRPREAAVGGIVSKYGASGYSLALTAAGKVNGYLDGSGSNSFDFDSDTTLELNAFSMVSLVYNTTANTATIYINGVKDAQVAATVDPVDQAGDLRIGQNSGVSFPGDIAEVRLWDVARTAEEIAGYQYAGWDGVPGNLIGWWKFGEGTGTTLGDSAETPHNGTITGTGALTYYLYDAVATGSAHGKIDTTTTTAATLATGWIPGTTAPTEYSLMLWGTERAESTFTSTVQPGSSPTTTDCWRSESALRGTFAAGNFSVACAVRAVTTGGSQDGRCRVRIWKSSSATGVGAIEITSGATAGTTVSNVPTASTSTSTATCAISAARFDDEYLFVQVAWEITGAGAGAGCDILLRANESTVTTTTLRPTWIDTYEGEEGLAGQYKPWAIGSCWRKEPVLIDADKLIYAVNSRGLANDQGNNFPSSAPIVEDGGVAYDLDADAAAKTYYVYNVVATGSSHGKIDETATTASTTGTGWTVGTVASGNYSLMLYGTERATGTFGATAMPNAAPTTTDCWRSESTITGRFQAGTWTGRVSVIAVSTPGTPTQDARVRMRIWKSVNADGSAATEITSSTATGSTVTNLGGGTKQTSTVTASCAVVDFAAEYLFFQLALEIVGAGDNASRDVLIRKGDSTFETTPFSSGGVTSGSDLGNSTVASGMMRYDATLGLFRLGTAPTTRCAVSFCGAAYDGDNTDEPRGQIRAIVEGSGEFSSGSVSVAQTDFYPAGTPPLISGIYIPAGQTTCVEVLRRVLHNYRASGGFQADGIFRARAYTNARLTGTASLYDYTKDDMASLRLVNVLDPVKEVLVRYKPYEPPYGPSELLGAVTQEERFDLTQGARKLTKPNVVDRYGNAMTLYKESARKIVVDTDMVNDWALAYTIQPILDAFDAKQRVVEFELLQGTTSKKPKLGDPVTLTYARFNFDSAVDCLVAGMTESQPGDVIVLQLIDATTLLS